MKKLIISVAVGVMMLASYEAGAYSLSIQVQPNSMTNLFAELPVTNGSFVVNQVIITANNTNSTLAFVDTPYGALTNLVSAYTNRISYATNYITAWTNFYGVVQSTTNIAYVDFTNNVVPAITNNYPIVISAGAAAGTSTVIANARYVFQYGIWITNTAATGYPGLPTVTVNYNTP